MTEKFDGIMVIEQNKDGSWNYHDLKDKNYPKRKLSKFMACAKAIAYAKEHNYDTQLKPFHLR